MIATAKNYDVICFQLRNNSNQQLENPLKNDLDILSDNIKKIIISGENVSSLSMEMLSQVFNLRIKALKYLPNNTNYNYSESFKDVYIQIEELRSNANLDVLIDNILFALRCNQRVVKSINNFNGFTQNTYTSNLAELPDITYLQFITSLAYANLHDETTQKIVDFTKASLNIEFVLVATHIIGYERLKISDKTINDLTFLIADSAQEYSALATELGLLKSRSTTHSISNLTFDNDFIQEQKQIADLGLDDLVINDLPNEAEL